MHKIKIPILFICFAMNLISSQSQNSDKQLKWMENWTNFNPNQTIYPEPNETLPKIINEDLYLSNDNTYLLSGIVYVTDNATLTIQEGTVIRCDHSTPTSLIVSRGSKLIAYGIKGLPIVFTSSNKEKMRKSGDWGGISIAGNGHTNLPGQNGMIEGNFIPQYSVYGGKDSSEASSILSYVRIEYAGGKIDSKTDLNGLSLYALGKNSIINHIMVSYSGDDAFEFYGGNIEASHLVTFKTKDDDYDFTQGFMGTLRNIVAIRHPYISDTSGSYAIEIDGYQKNHDNTNSYTGTDVKIVDATLVNLADSTNYQHTFSAISCNNSAKISISDSKISGFKNVIKFDRSYTTINEIENSFHLENSIFNIHGANIATDSVINTDQKSIFKYNMYTTQFKEVRDLFSDPLNKVNPDFSLKQSLENYTSMQ